MNAVAGALSDEGYQWQIQPCETERHDVVICEKEPEDAHLLKEGAVLTCL
jgi:hypothetical protein